MPMTFDEFMQAYEQQGGPLPSAWSDEAIAEAQNKANMMSNAVVAPNRTIKGRVLNPNLESREVLRQKNILKGMSDLKHGSDWDKSIYDIGNNLAENRMLKEQYSSPISDSMYFETPSGKKLRFSNHDTPLSASDHKASYMDSNPLTMGDDVLTKKQMIDNFYRDSNEFIKLEKWLRRKK